MCAALPPRYTPVTGYPNRLAAAATDRGYGGTRSENFKSGLFSPASFRERPPTPTPPPPRAHDRGNGFLLGRVRAKTQTVSVPVANYYRRRDLCGSGPAGHRAIRSNAFEHHYTQHAEYTCRRRMGATANGTVGIER